MIWRRSWMTMSYISSVFLVLLLDRLRQSGRQAAKNRALTDEQKKPAKKEQAATSGHASNPEQQALSFELE